MSSGRIQQRIDPKLQKDAETILKTQGIKPSQAIILFYMEIKRSRGLPFSPSPVRLDEVPNIKLQKDLEDASKGKGVKISKNKDEFFDHLDKL
ncbi:type II toxin-antitoxin system RelB/DinJ family antitoxin [Patescibacteria group bacterium]|nr:type II toxin-antitoxin system RelB/DinJ family antitoxin [Patescibacteria group bacterium]MBU1124132.1 type II toxin-antitoxin system RelB/DinJ family antitoxin [Patescibacteria group bacterium]